MSVIRLLDQSHKLGIHLTSIIQTKDELFKILRQYLDQLFDGKMMILNYFGQHILYLLLKRR